MTATPTPSARTDRLQQVDFDLLRDVHKAIRAALFSVTANAGRVDPSDDSSVAALESELRGVAELLTDHAGHEDGYFDVAVHCPELAPQIEEEHTALDARMDWLVQLAHEASLAAPPDRRFALHELYLELASFTAAYLSHQDYEERALGPAMVQRLGRDGLLAIDGRIVASVTPEQFTRGFAAMIPAMNLDDRCDMLGAMRAGMPAEAFAGVWGLTTTLLAPDDAAALAGRLGL